jgi:hypothetical protein
VFAIEFTNIWESAFDITDTALFNCQVNRSKADPTTSMFLINHFLDSIVLGVPTPNFVAANVTNAVSGVGSLGAEVATCVSLYNRNPNFLLVDVSNSLPLCHRHTDDYLLVL